MSLVLVVEPDSSQADILRRALRKRADIELVLVKSTKAALQSIDQSIPDLILLSALLSPRDEDSLISHLRTLEGASHLQTLTIPQLGSSLQSSDDGGKGALNRFRKKKSAPTSIGADPAVFAEEIVAHAAHAAELRLRARDMAQTRVLEPEYTEPAHTEPAYTEPVDNEPAYREPVSTILEDPAVAEPFLVPPDPFVAAPALVMDAASPAPVAARTADDLLTGALTSLISLEAAARQTESQNSWDAAPALVAPPPEPIVDYSQPVSFDYSTIPTAEDRLPAPAEYTPPVAAAAEMPVGESSVFDLPAAETATFEPVNLTDSIFGTDPSGPEEESVFTIDDSDVDFRPPSINTASVLGTVDDEVERLAGELGFDPSTLRIESLDSPAAIAKSEADAERDLLAEVAAVQAEAEAKLAEELARVRAEAEERRVAEMARLQAEADELRQKAINEARAAAEAEARAALAAELARARSEAEGTLSEVLNRAKQEAEQARQEAERARQEAEQRVGAAEQQLGAEVGRAREDAETLRSNLERVQAEAERVQAEASEARAKIDQLTALREHAETAFASELARVRLEAEQTLNAQLDAARAEAERLKAEPARVKAEAERLRLTAAEEARRAAEAAAARALEEEVTRVRAEAEGRLRAELDRIRKEAEQSRLADQSQAKHASQQLTQQLREAATREARAIAEAAAHRTLESEIARVRQDADTVLESELTKARADAERRQVNELHDLKQMMAEMREAAAQQARAAAAEAVAAEVAKISPRTDSGSISFSDDRDTDRISYYGWWKARRQAKRAVSDIQSALRARGGALDRLSFLRSKWALPVAAGVLLVAANQGIAINTVSHFISPSKKEPAVIAVAEAAKAPPPVVEKKSGELKVETTPAGAEVTIAGKRYGKTPLTIPDLREGTYTLVLQSPSGTISRKVTIRNGKTTVASEAIFAGWLAIFSPIPLDIVLNGKGATPSDDGRFMVAPGRYEVEMVNQRFNYRGRETLEVRPGQVTAHTLQLPSGVVRLSAPEGVEIRVDGEVVGRMPLPHLSVSLGTHQISATHPDLGERNATIDVKHGETADVTLSFNP